MRACSPHPPRQMHELLVYALECESEDGFARACAAVFAQRRMDSRQIEFVLTSGGAHRRIATLVWVLWAKCRVPTEPPRVESALSIAVRLNNLYAARALLGRCGAVFNPKYDPPETLTFYSLARNNQTAMLELLGEHAARLRKQVRPDCACYADGLTALHYAVLKRNLGAVRVLVRDFGVCCDVRDHFKKRPVDYLPSVDTCPNSKRFIIGEITKLLVAPK